MPEIPENCGYAKRTILGEMDLPGPGFRWSVATDWLPLFGYTKHKPTVMASVAPNNVPN